MVLKKDSLSPFDLKPFCPFVNYSDHQPYNTRRNKEIDPHIGQIYPFRQKKVSEKIHKGENHKDVDKTVVFSLKNIFYREWKLRWNVFK